MKYLSLTIGGTPIEAPKEVPTGGTDTLQKLIEIGVNLFFLGGILAALLMIIYSGIQWVLSGGDKEKIQQARERLIYTIVGLIVISASFFIIKAVIVAFGGKANFWPTFL
ncbi:MAG: hypothetical protein HYT08_03230 [Candidatus Levybacteria bacterium]|nr:hypothetical protein [Candidatus Levybacteria bacterium]